MQVATSYKTVHAAGSSALPAVEDRTAGCYSSRYQLWKTLQLDASRYQLWSLAKDRSPSLQMKESDINDAE